MVYDPHTLKHYWINKPLIFNYFGYPDCLDTPYGPRFAPSFRFGYSQQFDQEDFAPPPIGYAILKSRPWTARDIVLYLRDWNYIAEGVNRPNIPIDVGNLDLPNGISWPKQAGEVLGTLRTIQHFDLNNTSLLDALTQTAKKVGAYEVYFTPKGNFVSEVGFVSMYAKSNTGTTLYMPTYGNPSLETVIDSANIIKYAKIIENDSNAFEQTRIIGDRPAVERFMSTNFFNPLPNGTSNGIVDGIPGCEGFLVPAWTPADEQAWKDYIQNHKTDHNDPNNPNDNETYLPRAIVEANAIWPTVYCAYQVDNTKAGGGPFSGTKWSAMPVSSRNPEILPQLLTGYNESQSNPRNWIPLPARFEYRIVETPNQYYQYYGGGPNMKPKSQDALNGLEPWLPGTAFDGQSLDPNSQTVYFPIARATSMANDTNISSPSGGSLTFQIQDLETYENNNPIPIVYNVKDTPGKGIFARNIRITLAVEHDLPIVGFNNDDVNNAMLRKSSGAPKFAYVAAAEPMDYTEKLRISSRPLGWARINQNIAVFPDRCVAGSELFTDRPGDVFNPDPTGREMTHASLRQIDVNRVEISGVIVLDGIKPYYPPGTSIRLVGDNLVPCYGVSKAQEFVFGLGPGDQQETIIHLTSSEPITIQDTPSGPRLSSWYGVPGMVPPVKKTDNYQYKETGTGTGKTTAPGTESNYDEGTIGPRKDAPQVGAGGDRRQQGRRIGGDAGQGSMVMPNGQEVGAGGLGEFAFGKPSSGSINGKTDIMNAMGKPSQGSINGKTSLNDAAAGIADTRKADAYDRRNYKSVAEQHQFNSFAGPGNNTSGQVPKGTRLWDSRNRAGASIGDAVSARRQFVNRPGAPTVNLGALGKSPTGGMKAHNIQDDEMAKARAKGDFEDR